MVKNNKKEKKEYKEQTVEQTISTKKPLYAKVSQKGNHVVLSNRKAYDFTVVIDLEALLGVLERGPVDPDYDDDQTDDLPFAYANFIVHDKDEEQFTPHIFLKMKKVNAWIWRNKMINIVIEIRKEKEEEDEDITIVIEEEEEVK